MPRSLPRCSINCSGRHCIQIKGSSYHLRQHADLMPEHVRSKAVINSPIPGQLPAAAAQPENGANDHHPVGCSPEPVS